MTQDIDGHYQIQIGPVVSCAYSASLSWYCDTITHASHVNNVLTNTEYIYIRTTPLPGDNLAETTYVNLEATLLFIIIHIFG